LDALISNFPIRRAVPCDIVGRQTPIPVSGALAPAGHTPANSRRLRASGGRAEETSGGGKL